MAMFVEAWGRGLKILDVSQTRVEAYCSKRRRLDVVAPGLRPDKDGSRRRGYRTPKPVRDGALHSELSWLSTVLNWARGFRVGGRRLLVENPMHGLDWPREKNPRRPVAAHQRYMATQQHTDEVDPAGRLRCLLALARFTGRRESALCAIRASDLLLSAERVRVALASAGMDERLTDHMPHGAIRWAAESDKEGFLFISPINRSAREALEAYLRQYPCVGDVPLFPAPGKPHSPIGRERAAKWLLRAEKLASQPKLVGGVFHPYRRLWATERKDLPDVDVAQAGGWRDTRALKNSYQQADPETVLRVVEHCSG
jgi:integrase